MNIPKFARTMPSYITAISFIGTIGAGIIYATLAWGHNQDRLTALERRADMQQAARAKDREDLGVQLTEQKKLLSDHSVTIAVTANNVEAVKATVEKMDGKLDRLLLKH